MVPIFFIEKVDLVVEHLDAHEHRSLVLGAPAKCLHFAGLCIFLIDMLMIIAIPGIDLIKKERQKNQIMVEILQ